MKKQFILLTLIILGSVHFPSLKNNGANACGNKCNAACFVTKKTSVKATHFCYDEGYAHMEVLPHPVFNLIN